jgi:hypothetical protein
MYLFGIYFYEIPILLRLYISVPDSKSRNIPEVIIVRRGAGGVLGIVEGGSVG